MKLLKEAETLAILKIINESLEPLETKEIEQLDKKVKLKENKLEQEKELGYGGVRKNEKNYT
jgi:hypothetical protein